LSDNAIDSILEHLRDAEKAVGDAIIKGDFAEAGMYADVARKYALSLLLFALADFSARGAGPASYTLDDIRAAEDRLNVPFGVFSEHFRNPGRGNAKPLEAVLSSVADNLYSRPADDSRPAEPDLLPLVVRFASAVAVGVVVGAPLSALAVGEPVADEVIKASIAVTASAAASVVTDELLAQRSPKPLPRPPTPTRPTPRKPLSLRDQRSRHPSHDTTMAPHPSHSQGTDPDEPRPPGIAPPGPGRGR
jgi:hypothetical protein